ncbi:MAG: hypothetical protein CME70_18095 [Halobacteriovorax sp.]|nr:hypothetical protein [Halobacteriovorax sp.]
MAKQIIDNLDPGTLDGDSLFQAAEKINANFAEIYNTLGDGNTITPGGIGNIANGLIVAIGAGQFIGREIVSQTASITITNGTGLAGNPTIDLTNSGVVAGTYSEHGLTVSAQGIITGIATPQFLTDAQTASTTAVAAAATASADVATIGTSLADAQTAATSAQTSANSASTDAGTASTDASTASTAAASATASATSATASEASATASATSATASASTATAAATTATNAVNSIGTSVTDAQTAATSAENSWDSFDDRYLGAKSSAPSVDNDGDALITGALYFDSTADEMRVYNGSSWAAAGSAINGTTNRNTYTATANQTTFASVYDVGFVDVYLNGLKLMPADFTATSGTDIVLASGAALNDTVDIVGYGAFAVANTLTETQSDAKYAQLSNNLSDLASASTARTNLGLAAVASSGSYSDLTGTPSAANNISGGTAMGVLYQSATDTTAHLPAGSSGHILQTNGTGSAPTWVPKSSVASPTGIASIMKFS